MRFYPRNAQSRHDALVGPDHVSDHGRPDEKGRRDRLNRYSQAAEQASLALTGTVAAVAQAAFRLGGTLVYTLSGDDAFQADAVTARSVALIAAFAGVTGLTLDQSAFALSAANTVLTVTVPVNTATTGTKSISFTQDLFLNANQPVLKALVIS